MKRKTTALKLTLALLLLAVAVTQFVELVSANFFSETYTASPIISIHSPLDNETYSSNDAPLNFTITKPERGWLISWKRINNPNLVIKNKLYYVNIIIDGKLYRSMEADSDLSSPFSYYEHLTNLEDGAHNLTIQAECDGWDLEIHGVWERYLSYDVSSDLINFTVDTIPPNVSILSVENKTYYTTDVPLDFAVNQSVSQIAYSLDGQDNVTITGNITLTGVPNGYHNITVYATDKARNTGASETIHFALEEPFPVMPVAAVSLAVVAVAGAGLLVYFKKRKH